jgi:dipeptidyl aminopeptidase/acylaminoacyl peptidase
VARATSGGVVRVAYQGQKINVSLRVVELQPSGAAQPVGIAKPLANQTASLDCGGAFSPDGLQYAFRSARTGEMRFWIVGRDGSGLRPFTPLNVVAGRSNSWSPDGTRIVFDWVGPDGNDDIYIGDVAGGKPVRLTTDPSVDWAASWSHDGRWIYFVSDRSGSVQIWKMPASGGAAIRVTSGFGFEPYPSPDGKFIYYVTCLPGQRPCPLKRVPVDGGPEVVVLDGVAAAHWSITAKGIYFLSREGGRDWLDLFDPRTSKRVRLGSLPFRSNHCGFISVSPNGSHLIGNHVDKYEADIGLVEITR